MEKPVLDACCGARLFWHDKKDTRAVFCDIRDVDRHEYYPGRFLEVKPDVVCDFTALPFPDGFFAHVVFDPPHLSNAGPKSWMAAKYGRLDANWPQLIRDGHRECMRVLMDYGTLIFKWSEVQIPLRDVLAAIGEKPLYGHRVGRQNKTHWMAFIKMPKEEDE